MASRSAFSRLYVRALAAERFEAAGSRLARWLPLGAGVSTLAALAGWAGGGPDRALVAAWAWVAALAACALGAAAALRLPPGVRGKTAKRLDLELGGDGALVAAAALADGQAASRLAPLVHARADAIAAGARLRPQRI